MENQCPDTFINNADPISDANNNNLADCNIINEKNTTNSKKIHNNNIINNTNNSSTSNTESKEHTTTTTTNNSNNNNNRNSNNIFNNNDINFSNYNNHHSDDHANYIDCNNNNIHDSSINNNNNSTIYNNNGEDEDMNNIRNKINNTNKLHPSFYNYFFTKNQDIRDNSDENNNHFHRPNTNSNNNTFFLDRGNNSNITQGEDLSKSLDEINPHVVPCVRGVRTITRNPGRVTRHNPLGVAVKYRGSHGRHPDIPVAKEKDRARMFNEAFDCLRKRIPSIPASKKLSKIEILRLAICYMSYLKFLLEGDPQSDKVSGSDSCAGGEAETKSSCSPPIDKDKENSSDTSLSDVPMTS